MTQQHCLTEKNGQRWIKEIAIRIVFPATYELFQNYPNPFNPAAVISYQLSEVSVVCLSVYDVLGREISTLVNERQEPGYYQKTFDAHRFSSGIYIYQHLATDDKNNHHVFQKKMEILK